MFTGIVKGLCPIKAIEEVSGMRHLTVDLQEWGDEIELGASVAINGTCLSAVSVKGTEVRFDLIQETLACTNLGALVVGDRVNVERSCRVGDEIGGHHVMGHIDTVGKIDMIHETPNNQEVFVHHDVRWGKYLVPKGWVAIDGVSLTVVAVEPNRFSVCLIPETLSRTTLGFKRENELVNLEFDHMTKVIVHTVERMNSVNKE